MRADMAFLNEANRQILLKRHLAREAVRDKPVVSIGLLDPSRVRVLLVTDMGLDYGRQDLGLSTFIEALLQSDLPYARFDITLAHRREFAVTDPRMLPDEPRIQDRISSFRFTDPRHFGPGSFDVVMLFGFENAASAELNQSELRVLTEFMNAGGGVFATGDHGDIGRALCHAVPRVRGMRRWDFSLPKQGGDEHPRDEVGMNGERRNDTNQAGADGWQFDDQSDALPQRIRLVSFGGSRSFGLRISAPHPVLCSPRGPITVLPDHAHEGECVEPADTRQSLSFADVPLGPEYPPAAGGGARPVPRIVARGTVPAGNGVDPKLPTEAHDFGLICTYDGHRARVGRVVTDATWHHFVNMNLIGTRYPQDGMGGSSPKAYGFLSSPEGQAHLEDIRTYYRNLVTWLTPPERIRAMRAKFVWFALWNERVMEAVMATTRVSLGDLGPPLLRAIGHQARDVIGAVAGQCTYLELVRDFALPELPGLAERFDPWGRPPEPPFEGVPWLDISLIGEIALGAALVALREAYPEPDLALVERLDAEAIAAPMAKGGAFGAQLALRDLEAMSGAALAGLREQRRPVSETND